jgi:hypothetical protein
VHDEKGSRVLVDASDESCPSGLLGSPGKNLVKRVVQQVKPLAREYHAWPDDLELLRRIERVMAGEEETVAKSQAAMAARQAIGA